MSENYRTFHIPKRSGGKRRIDAPKPHLKKKQREILNELEERKEYKPSYFTHSFMSGRNCVTAAKPHVGKKYLYKMDVSDFFGSIKFSNFVSQFVNSVCDEDIASSRWLRKENEKKILDKIDLDFLKKLYNRCWRREIKLSEENSSFKDIIHKILFVTRNLDDKTFLAQGAPTSPFLSNVFLRTFDWRVARFAARPEVDDYEFSNVYYTRYADDLFFSSEDRAWLNKLISYTESQLKRLGLTTNDKGGFFKDGQRKQVCGIIVNEKLNLPREIRRKNRARRHQAQFDDRGMDDLRRGKLAFGEMIEKQKEKGFPANNIEVTRRLFAIDQI